MSDPDVSVNDFHRWYILPTDNLDRFNQVLNQRTNTRYEFLTGKKGDFFLKLTPLNEEQFKILKLSPVISKNFETSIKETIVKHYEGFVRGFRGVFWLEGEPEILQFIYDCGLGVRTGQGFGLLEILSQ